MAVHDPTAANVSLWARFFEEEWAAAGDAAPQPYLVRAVAAAVAGWLTVVVAPQIAQIYDENRTLVDGFIAAPGESDERVAVPPAYRRGYDAVADRAARSHAHGATALAFSGSR